MWVSKHDTTHCPRMMPPVEALRKENEHLQSRIDNERPRFDLSTDISCFARVHLRDSKALHIPAPGPFDAFKWLQETKLQQAMAQKDADAARVRPPSLASSSNLSSSLPLFDHRRRSEALSGI